MKLPAPPIDRDDIWAGLINGAMLILLGSVLPGFALWRMVSAFDASMALRASIRDWTSIGLNLSFVMLLFCSIGMICWGAALFLANLSRRRISR